MNNFNVGDHVMTIENGEIRKGVVNKVFPGMPVIFVEFEDGNIEKVAVDRLALEPRKDVSSDAETPEKKTESQNGAKRITKTEFINAVSRVTSPEGMLGDKSTDVDPMSLFLKGMAVHIVGLKICDKLFGDNDVIEITRGQLKKAIIENTTPGAISESVNGQMSIESVFPISLLSVLVLKKLIFDFFGEADNA